MVIDAPDRQQRSPVDHLVHFFDSAEGLVEAVTGHLAVAMLEGDAVIVIATADHRARIRDALAAAGVDLTASERTNQLQVLDAGETLERFVVDGRPDRAAFVSIVGGAVQAAGAGGRRVRAYGEMVALLWAAGDVSGAIRLEQLWNELARELPLALFCAYPAHLFEDPSAAERFADLCDVHSEVVAGAPHPSGCDVVRRFPRARNAARLARQFVQRTLSDWSMPPETLDDALLVTSELVTNALLHASSDVAVGLTRTATGVRVTVADASRRDPQVREADAETPSGRGLAMVRTVASAWGHAAIDGGKLVWADLDALSG